MVKLETKESKVKSHFKKHKNRYLVGLTVVGVGTTCLFIGKKWGATINVVDNSSSLANNAVVNIKPTNVQKNHNTYITNITNELSRPGNAGNIIYCPEVDRTFNSQSEAEKILKLGKGTVSKQISGQTKHVKGHTFKKIGDFNSDKPRVSTESILGG